MGLKPGGIAFLAAVLFFYIRLIWLQRAKVTLARQAAAQSDNGQKQHSRKSKKERTYFDRFRLRIINWYLLIGAVVLIAAGAFISTTGLWGETVRSLWWLPTAGGIFMGSFSFA